MDLTKTYKTPRKYYIHSRLENERQCRSMLWNIDGCILNTEQNAKMGGPHSHNV